MNMVVNLNNTLLGNSLKISKANLKIIKTLLQIKCVTILGDYVIREKENQEL